MGFKSPGDAVNTEVKPPPPSSAERRKRVANSGALSRLLGELDSDPTILGGATPHVQPERPHATPAASQVTLYPSANRARVDPRVCRPWRLADRPQGEFADLDQLGQSLLADGQVQASVVRVCHDASDPEIRFEIIAGVRRWQAALRAGFQLDVVIRELDDKAAFRMMLAENDFRADLSDYARAKRYSVAMAEGFASSLTELAEMSGLSNSELSYYMGFASLAPEIVSSITNIASLSLRIGYALSVAQGRGYMAQIIRDMPKIENGDIRVADIPRVWDDHSNVGDEERPTRPRASATPFASPSGEQLFTKVVSRSGAVTLKFPKEFASYVSDATLARLVDLIQSERK